MDWKLSVLLLEFLALSFGSSNETKATMETMEVKSVEEWWSEAGRKFGETVGDCWSSATAAPVGGQSRKYLNALSRCLQVRVRSALGRALSSDVIPLAGGVELVRYQMQNDSQPGIRRSARMKDEKYGNDTPLATWRSLLVDTLSDVFQTHAIRISLRDLQPLSTNQARRRRRKNFMLPLMMFGLVGLGMILIPMGFQFLAVLGGKALLLAKMALILTSIQGLKKVAHSKLNYGLYHSAPATPWYDRKAEDVEHPNRIEELHYNQYPEQILEYKRYPRP